jgi:hypothetical protein
MKTFASLLLFCLAQICTTTARAEIIESTIRGTITGITGSQLPTGIFLGDSIDIKYRYETGGSFYTINYLDGRSNPVELVYLTPGDSALWYGDTKGSFSANLIATFSEFTGNNGYVHNSNLVADFPYNRRRFYDTIYPSIKTYLEFDTTNPSSFVYSGGLISMWQEGQTGVTKLDYSFTVESAVIPLPSTIGLLVSCFIPLIFIGVLKKKIKPQPLFVKRQRLT